MDSRERAAQTIYPGWYELTVSVVPAQQSAYKGDRQAVGPVAAIAYLADNNPESSPQEARVMKDGARSSVRGGPVYAGGRGMSILHTRYLVRSMDCPKNLGTM